MLQKSEFSSALFAFVAGGGDAAYDYASHSVGVRPEFWLVKQESRALCPVDLAVILGALMLVQKTFCIIVRMM